jgi:membrane peptidoglycan carboxypeptidase
LDFGKQLSKNRIMEVYLNIIEWGPNVYGIGEAAKFYFNTTPDKLTYPQCVYLASIIPSPKKFKYTFDEEAKLKAYMKYIFSLVSRRMLAKGQITPEDTVALMPSVKLTGPAYNQLKLKSVDDSLSEEEKEGFFENLLIKKKIN